MVKALLKHDIKTGYGIFLTVLALLVMYMAVITMMYDPGSLDAIKQLLDAMPKQFVSALGFDSMGTSLMGFMASYYYSFVIILFPMIYCIVVAGRLIARYVDRGSMAYLLSTPSKRRAIASTQALYFAGSLLVMMGINSVVGILICNSTFPSLLDVPAYWTMNLMSLLLFLAISAIGFFFSCLFDDARLSSAFGTGILLFFYVLNMLSNVDDKLSYLKNFTLFALFDPMKVLDGSASVAMAAVIFILVAAAGYFGGIMVFSRRDMAL